MNSGKYSRDRMVIHAAENNDVVFDIKGGAPQDGTISGRIFGNFLEQLGFATQGGILAQVLNNPALTMDDNLTAQVRKNMVRNGEILEQTAVLGEEQAQKIFGGQLIRRVGSGFSAAVLDDMREAGIPFPWKANPHIFAKGGQKGRVGNSVALTPKGSEVTLSQGVFLAQHRVLTYEGHIWARSDRDIKLEVRLARRCGEVLSAVPLKSPTLRWTKLAFTLKLPDTLKKGEPVDFQIAADGNGDVFIDRACLSPTDHVFGFDPEFLELTKKYAPPILRGPGGNFVSGYHFWHGIGDVDYRQTFKNPAWIGIETNFFGPDEFLKLCELIGSEPQLVINLGDGIPEEAAAWVEYINGPADSVWGAKRAANGHPEPYNVRLWEVGNEIYGEWQVGNCGDIENARRYRETAKAMLAADPTIELIGNGTEFDFYQENLNWNRTLMEEGGETLSSISLHALPHNEGNNPALSLDEVWLALQAQPSRWEKTDIPNMIDTAHEVLPGKHIDYAITEWGILGMAPYSPAIRNSGGSVFGASFYNFCLRLKEYIKVTNATALYHGGCLARFGIYNYIDPQLEVIKRYTEFTGGTLFPIEYTGPVYQVKRRLNAVPATSDIPVMDAVCVKTVNGNTVIALVNRHPHICFPVELRLNGFEGTELTYCEMQHGDSMNDINTPLTPDKVTFKPHEAKKEGAVIKLNAPEQSVIFITLR